MVLDLASFIAILWSAVFTAMVQGDNRCSTIHYDKPLNPACATPHHIYPLSSYNPTRLEHATPEQKAKRAECMDFCINLRHCRSFGMKDNYECAYSLYRNYNLEYLMGVRAKYIVDLICYHICRE